MPEDARAPALNPLGQARTLGLDGWCINAETQLLWPSGYPQWNIDLPGAIAGRPFLSETAKRNILGGNAHRLFGLNTV